MNSYVNYVVEANIGLLLFMAAYLVILARETDFAIQRIFLVAGIIASLTFPLIHFSFSENSIPTLSQLLPSYLLPELIVSDQEALNVQAVNTGTDIWQWLAFVYVAGLLVCLSLFVTRLAHLMKKLRGTSFSMIGKYKVIESADHKHTFSFFNYIFLGQTDVLSADEKQRILQHEAVHSRRLHSFDVLLLNITGILFWFNPVLKIYKKIFIQLHEFEADARAVEDRDVNDYCTLLAKVALQSADFRLANHFNNSLTLKRIKMMRTLKQKIKTWKILAIASVIPLVFFVLACQDQVMSDLAQIAKNSNNALIVPNDIQARYETLKKQNPNSNYILIEFNEVAEKQLAEMESKYGLPKHIELYTPDGQKHQATGSVTIEPETPQLQTFAIIEYNDLTKDISNQSKLDGDVFTIVEETASPAGGIQEFYKHLGSNLTYPAEARKKGIVGQVLVEFIVQKDGSLTDINILKGIDTGCDEEAARVVRSYPDKWIPGKNQGVPVKQKMVLPINFKLPDVNDNHATKSSPGTINEIVVVGSRPTVE